MLDLNEINRKFDKDMYDPDLVKDYKLPNLDNIIEWINRNLSPSEVFDENKLYDWANAKGLIKES